MVNLKGLKKLVDNTEHQSWKKNLVLPKYPLQNLRHKIQKKLLKLNK